MKNPEFLPWVELSMKLLKDPSRSSPKIFSATGYVRLMPCLNFVYNFTLITAFRLRVLRAFF